MNHFKRYRQILIACLSVLASQLFAQQVIIPQTIPQIINEWQDSRYTIDTTKNTVTDTATGLMWKRCSEGQSNVGCTGTASTMTWKTALETAKNSTFAGHDDWRVPNIKELSSIVARDRYNPSINATVFPNTATSYYWSSSPDTNTSYSVWLIHFSDGHDSNSLSLRDYDYRVRLVRGGQ